MRLHRRLAHAALALLSLAGIASLSRTSGVRPLLATGLAPSGEQREVARIRSHFDSVLAELAASTPPSGAGARRRALMATLRAYRDRGVFPHNYDFPGEAVPYFVDRRTGTRCAVAHLLESTGRRDIVDRVARSNNNVRVAQLASDSAFVSWLDDNDLTLAEAARIQVPYMQPSSSAQVARNSAFLLVVPVALGTATVTGLLNAFGNSDGHRRATRILGIASGLVSVGAGAALLSKSAVPRPLGATMTAMGGLSVALASRATSRHNGIVARERQAESPHGAVQASLSPVMGGGTGAGLALSLRY